MSILYKQLVGREVITTEVEGDQNIRLYAHCAKANNLWGDGSAVVGNSLCYVVRLLVKTRFFFSIWSEFK